jgi:hypothetical protein
LYFNNLSDIPKVFQADKEIVLAACRENGEALGYASAEMQADNEVVLAAVQKYGRALQFDSLAILLSNRLPLLV